ncbi:MAG: methionyl-tRNA formyltransferase [Candidatus Omnitrophica bacterium]|nr:methionyl-tRNA formyltransferase [Candidatus Omnitrophota bacterium]
MNIIFFGTSDFAVPSLRALSKSAHKISCVITRPDKKGGRGMQLLSSPVKVAAYELGLEILQPENLLSQDIVALLKKKRADLFVVIAYGEILRKEILEIPKKYCINLHASLLPKYRGAAPCNWAVINAEPQTGVTVIKLNEKVDAGDIITSQTISISRENTSLDVYRELSIVGAETLAATVGLVSSGREVFTKQNERLATYAPKLKKEDGLINWNNPAQKIQCLIRGTQPWPGAYTCLPAGQAGIDGKLLKIYKAEAGGEKSGYSPGEIIDVSREYFTIACANSALRVLEVQAEGKNRMAAMEFLKGAHLEIKQRLG